MIEAALFYLFGGLTILSAMAVISAKNPVHSVLYLILAFFNTAALFLMLGAEFLAMLLIIVYVGAVMVLFLFVVMMLNINFTELRKGFHKYSLIGFLVGFALLIELAMIFGVSMYAPDSFGRAVQNPTPTDLTNTEALGQLLYTDYIYIFQAAGMILLVAMIGAIVLTHRKREGVKKQNIRKQVSRTAKDAIEVKKVNIGEGIK
ncbi:MAG: NADH-quinone oxidoreductase subunit J [Sphingomonadales bacterium]